MEAAVSGNVVLLWAARWPGQSKEMSWASLPCTCSPCAGGCWATGGGCWGAPPAGAIWGTRGHWCSSPAQLPSTGCSRTPHPSLVPALLQPSVRPPLVMGPELQVNVVCSPPPPPDAACTQGLRAEWPSRWTLPRTAPRRRPGPRWWPGRSSPAGTWAAALRCRAAAGAAEMRPGWGGRS